MKTVASVAQRIPRWTESARLARSEDAPVALVGALADGTGQDSTGLLPHEFLSESAPTSRGAKGNIRTGFTRYGCAHPPPCVGARGSRFAHQLETLEDFSPAYLERLRRRLEAKYTPEPTSGCWLWFGATTSAGYGSIGVGSRGHGTAIVRAAHRVMYLLERGPIATDLVLDHHCRNTACVNPWHLEPVTQVVNIARGRDARRRSEVA